MRHGAQLSVTDQRRAARHSVDYPVIGEHRALGDVKLHIANISANGIMTQGEDPVGRGERIIIRLPVIGKIEALKLWDANGKSGFQLERVIRLEDFLDVIEAMQAPLRARRGR